MPDSGRYIFNNLAPFPVLTAADIQFMKAEAAFRKGSKDIALTAYTKGINLSFDLLISEYQTRVPGNLQITDASRNAYLANTKVIPATSAGLNLSMIILFRIALHCMVTDLVKLGQICVGTIILI